MREFKGKVAVVTGAASGIGRALALHAAAEGMKVVLADIERRPLKALETELRSAGGEVLAVRTDVSRARHVVRLANRAREAFGGVQLLFNNAGVGAGATTWSSTDLDWEWVLGVNLWGTIHGLRAFVPMMTAQDADCHIVNTASVFGLLTAPGFGVYCAAKHAVVAVSEALYQELRVVGARVGVSVLCPAFVKTRILHAERNRPLRLWISRQRQGQPDVKQREVSAAWRWLIDQGMDAAEVASTTFAAIRQGRFYIYTHPGFQGLLEKHLEDLRLGRNPAPFSLEDVIKAAAEGQGNTPPG